MPETLIPMTPTLNSFTGSTEALGLANSMLEKCRNNDMECRRLPASSIRLPTRLVRIQENTARLSDEDDRPKRPYCTLSHCWGTRPMFKLLTTNIDELRKSIPVSKLPKTFQDAIIVTEALGFDYLWIDSLCIIQDSDSDWQKEAVLMSTVYGDAVVNIAASSAVDGSVGLFFNRDPIRESKFLVRTNTNDFYELLDKSRDVYNISLSESVLSSRGWCFQERFLAKGTLQFTKNQIFYECRRNTCCESMMEGIYDDWFLSSERKFPEDREMKPAWFKAVNLYSGTKLTYAADRLIAISGVAKSIKTKAEDSYIAGLWREELELQLCWEVDVGTSLPRNHNTTSSSPLRYSNVNVGCTWKESFLGRGEQILPYRAPSWSWAASDCSKSWNWVKRDGPPTFVLLSVTEVYLDPVGEDVFGQLKDARLSVVTGPLYTRAFISYLMAVADEDLDFFYERTRLLTKDWCNEILYDFHGSDSRSRTPCFFMPIFKQEELTTSWAEPTVGIILQADEERGVGYFRRVGVWKIAFAQSYTNFVARIYLLDRMPERKEKFLMDEGMYHKILAPTENGLPRFEILLV